MLAKKMGDFFTNRTRRGELLGALPLFYISFGWREMEMVLNPLVFHCTVYTNFQDLVPKSETRNQLKNFNCYRK
jgi:hypothetical protein